MRTPANRIAKKHFYWFPEGNRNTQRPKNTWLRGLESEMYDVGRAWRELQQIGRLDMLGPIPLWGMKSKGRRCSTTPDAPHSS